MIEGPPAERESLVTRQVTDSSTQRTFAVLSLVSGRLAISGIPALREIIRRASGQVFFGAPDHFRGDGAMDLAPLFDPDTALAPVPGISAIELRAVTVRVKGRGRVTFDGEGGDVRTGSWADEARAAMRKGIVTSARIDVKLDGRDAFGRVDVGPGAKPHFDCYDDELERAVRSLFVERRILPRSEPAPMHEPV